MLVTQLKSIHHFLSDVQTSHVYMRVPLGSFFGAGKILFIKDPVSIQEVVNSDDFWRCNPLDSQFKRRRNTRNSSGRKRPQGGHHSKWPQVAAIQINQRKEPSDREESNEKRKGVKRKRGLQTKERTSNEREDFKRKRGVNRKRGHQTKKERSQTKVRTSNEREESIEREDSNQRNYFKRKRRLKRKSREESSERGDFKRKKENHLWPFEHEG